MRAVRSRTFIVSLATAVVIILSSALGVLAAPNSRSNGRLDPPRRLTGEHDWLTDCIIHERAGMMDMSLDECASMMLMGPGSSMVIAEE